jgi:hypothetical protein
MINSETILSNSKRKSLIQMELSKMIKVRSSQPWILIKKRHLIKNKREMDIQETKIKSFLKNLK